MRTLRFEIFRSFQNKNMAISLLIGIVIVVFDLVTFIANHINIRASLIQAWIGTDYPYAYHSLYYVVLPIIACLPYAGSLYSDISTGYDKNICIKTSRMIYICSKVVATYLSAFFAVVFPLLFDLFIVAGIYPNYRAERLSFLVAAPLDCHLFSEAYVLNPVLYCIIFILLAGFFGGAIALISLSISRITKNLFSTITIPFIIYIFNGMMMGGYENGTYAVFEMIDPVPASITRPYQMIVTYFVLLIGTTFVIWLITRRRDVL